LALGEEVKGIYHGGTQRDTGEIGDDADGLRG
jgi:hypothetical protein